MTMTGGCQCGAVRYRIEPPLHVSVCHCRMCQKASGNPLSVFAVVPMERFAWTRGTPARFASSDIAERLFCAACGTPLAYLDKDGIELMAGSLDRPAELEPRFATGIEAKVPWVDGLPALPGHESRSDRPIVSRQHPDHDT